MISGASRGNTEKIQVLTPAALRSEEERAGHPGTSSQLAGEFLIFRLAAEEYGIDVVRVQEIRSYQPPTCIANAPDFVRGVINLRGVVMPILDLRLKFALQSVEYNDLTVVILLNLGRRVVDVIVDAA